MIWRLIKALIRAVKKCFGFKESDLEADPNADRLSDSDSDSSIQAPSYSPPPPTQVSNHSLKNGSFETLSLDSESDIDITPAASPPEERRGLFRRR